MSYDSSNLSKLLEGYYKNLFPFKPYVKWLSYNKKTIEYFNRREFAFILEDDVHLRYRSFTDELEFRKQLCDVAPHKLDIGAVYNHCPKNNKKHSDFKPVEREFVLDIDLTDYDSVRKCCSEAKVCSLCWKFVVAAVYALDRALKDDFGFTARMWVFSGRRGVHCWIGDEKARKLLNSGRSAIAEYLSFITGTRLTLHSQKAESQRGPRQVHPAIEKAYRCIMDSGIVDEMVSEQKWLDGDMEEVFAPYFNNNKAKNEEFKNSFLTDMAKLRPSKRWEYLKRRFDLIEREKAEIRGDTIGDLAPTSDRDLLRWFVLWHVYPRLDVNVSTGMNHLLKSPFCIHPKTGNVAVPLDVENIRQFDLSKCPRIDSLLVEHKKYMDSVDDNEERENRKILGYKHTALAPYVENFERFVNEAVSA